MVHRHVVRGRCWRVLVDQRVTAVTKINTGPRRPVKEIGTVVLRPTDAEVGIGRVDRYALELCRAKGGGVTIDPVQTLIIRPPDAAIVASVNDRRIRRR